MLFCADGQFWLTVDGNFMDICVLEWCKLFGDKRGKHYWKKVVTDERVFFTGMLADLGCTEGQFQDYIDEVKTYRNKFVAHLDDANTMVPPYLDKMKDSTFYLYEYLHANEEEDNCFRDTPIIRDYFLQSSSEVETVLDNL